MKFQSIILYFQVLLCSSYWIGSVVYGSYHHDNIFALFAYCGLGIIWLFCFYKIFRNERKKSGSQSKMKKHWMSFVSAFSLIPIIFVLFHYERILNSPTLIKAQHGIYADFKTDGTYIIKSGPWASKIHLYGKYTLRDSIIEIDRSGIDQVLVSNRFLIKYSTPEDEMKKPANVRLETEKYLVQIDNTGEIIKNWLSDFDSLGRKVFLPYRFEVVVDNTE